MQLSQKVTVFKKALDNWKNVLYNITVTYRDRGVGKMDNKMIANRLKSIRGEKTIRQVAKDCQISYSALAMYETGQRVPKDAIKIKLARYYNTSVEALFFAD